MISIIIKQTGIKKIPGSHWFPKPEFKPLRRAARFRLSIFLLYFFHSALSGQDALSDAALNHEIHGQTPKLTVITAAFDVHYYRLDLQFKPETKSLSGSTQVLLTVQHANTQTLQLDAGDNLSLQSVSVNNQPSLFQHSANILTITLPAVYQKGDRISILVTYTGVFTYPTRALTFGNAGTAPSIYSLSEPYGSKEWWVCNDDPADKADSADIVLTVPVTLTAVSNGTLRQVQTNPNNTRTFYWHSSYPIAPYLVSVAISNYTEYHQYYKTGNTDSMLVSHYIYPEAFASAKQNLDKTVFMLQLYSELFGSYPFSREKYGHAQFGWSGGMEHQTISSMGRFDELLIAHELTHQWFGDMVTNADWHSIWLHEGFATFGEALYLERTKGKTAYLDYIKEKMVLAKSVTRSVFVTDISSVSSIFNYASSYAKGCVVLHSLRSILGDSLFFQTLRNYLHAPAQAYNVATTQDFANAVQRVTGVNYNSFFEEWIFGKGYPSYELYWSKSQNRSTVTIDLNVTQVNRFTDQIFSMPITIKLLGVNRDTTLTLPNSQTNQSYQITCSFNPDRMEFDPNAAFINSSVVFYADDASNTLQGFTVFQNYPNPFNSSTAIAVYLPFIQDLHCTVYNTSGSIAKQFSFAAQPRGYRAYRLPMSELSSGVYFCRFTCEAGSITRKVLLLK